MRAVTGWDQLWGILCSSWVTFSQSIYDNLFFFNEQIMILDGYVIKVDWTQNQPSLGMYERLIRSRDKLKESEIRNEANND